MVPNQFGPPGKTVPIKFGPPGQMVPKNLHNSTWRPNYPYLNLCNCSALSTPIYQQGNVEQNNFQMIILIFFQDFLMIEWSIFHPQDQQKCDWLEYRGNKVVQRRFHKHKILCQNLSLFSNHPHKDLSIAIFFVVESYIFHMALYRLFFVRSTHHCINWPKIWQQIVHWSTS